MWDGTASNAKLVARAQGMHQNCDMTVTDSWLVLVSIEFVHERFKGSSLKMHGVYRGNNDVVAQWAIVGGTGEFAFAQGVATYKYWRKDGLNLREFNIRVRCPTLQIPLVPISPNKEGPLGGKGGRDVDIPSQPQRLESVTIRSGDLIDSLSFSYTDQAGMKQTAGPWGGPGGLEETITFGPTETLKKVFGTAGDFEGDTVVTSLTLVSNVKTYPAFVKATGTPSFSLPQWDASVIVGFFGRAGFFLHAIGAYVRN
ncbi:unnamed protein product [Alopecurus aequalis]